MFPQKPLCVILACFFFRWADSGRWSFQRRIVIRGDGLLVSRPWRRHCASLWDETGQEARSDHPGRGELALNGSASDKSNVRYGYFVFARARLNLGYGRGPKVEKIGRGNNFRTEGFWARNEWLRESVLRQLLKSLVIYYIHGLSITF